MVDEQLISVAKIPTGIGKSYIAAIVAWFYKAQDKRVAIVTSQPFLYLLIYIIVHLLFVLSI